MKGIGELKARINSVQDTVKITKAMYLVSAAKMTPCVSRLQGCRRYLSGMQQVVDQLYSPATRNNHFFVKAPMGKPAYIVVAGDKGLCGDYNDKVLSFAMRRIQADTTAPVQLFAVGNVTQTYFLSHGYPICSAFVHMMHEPMFFDAQSIANKLMELYRQKLLGNVYIIYTQADSLYDQHPVIRHLLPFALPFNDQDPPLSIEQTDVDQLLYQYLCGLLYEVLLNAAVAINYKRMTTMQQSSNNGSQMLAQLQTTYNHRRQDAITGELCDVNTAREGKRN